MEDIFTIRVKTRPDSRNVYPSERRYSASTVAGLAWVHLALAATAFVLACLATVHPSGAAENISTHNETTEANATDITYGDELRGLLIVAPSVLTVASLAAGVCAILASTHWYIDRNITWLFITSLLSSAAALAALLMVIAWLSSIDNKDLPKFYNDKDPFEDFIVVPKSSVIDRNLSHIVVENGSKEFSISESLITNRVLSVNVLIACFLELLWSLLSVKISYKGMRTHYKDDGERPTGCIEVVTTVKGNKNLRSKPAPDLIKHYPTTIKRALEEQEPEPQVEESGSEYRERMMNFINRCGSFDAESEKVPSVRSEAVSTHPDVSSTRPIGSRDSTITWGDRDFTVYNQNNLDLGKILTEKIHSSLESESDSKEPAVSDTNEPAVPSQVATSENS